MPESRSFDLVIVGLGNPGMDYAHTRHNIGERVVRALADSMGVRLHEERRLKAEVGKGICNDRRIALVFPTTYMNLSGESLRCFVDYYKIAPSEVVVICDDVDLPIGTLRLKKGGSSGGHNGLKSIEKCLGSQEYPRLKIGVGAKRDQQDLAAHVLSRFTSEESLILPQIIENAVGIVKRLANEDIDKVMNETNQKVKRHLNEGEENCRESKTTKPL